MSDVNLSALTDIENALQQCPAHCKPLLLGDLNINLEYPRDERDGEVAERMDAVDFGDMSRMFQ